jgi:hypothetical protein
VLNEFGGEIETSCAVRIEQVKKVGLALQLARAPIASPLLHKE